ncbi:type IV secretion system protein VirB6 [Luteibacter sp. UNC138MFCol5.1]|uniref:type IV secretion system protein n=1 Tax=Luteibacter sp. UNC138MFCol5.1 TaxID=1502774 RepID=UPI0008D3A543|nr:type IV secretion system protein [Luteibacter sp. UNC138MFCol5.1]SEO82138.1 type IV secretion system protein VirB6 [Luteibacter sp. UNC138MFCol5.1]
MSNLADYVYFRLIYKFLIAQIDKFSTGLLERAMAWASFAALTLVTLWILIQGFRIATGRSRESLMVTVIELGRVAVIVAAASTMAVAGTGLRNLLTHDVDRAVHYLFTGSEGDTSKEIDRNLAYTQIALALLNKVQVIPGDDEMQTAKERSTLIATFGTASPPMVAGAMLLIYHFAMALFIGLGPIFILCLMFQQTKDLFKRWLLYGLGTVFSMGLLSVVVTIVLDLTARVSAAMWAGNAVNQLILGNNTEGLTSKAMQQGGIGLLLTALIVSVPPMAAAFFQGTLGSFMSYSAFGGGNSGYGPDGRPPGSWSAAPGLGQSRSQGPEGERASHERETYSARVPDSSTPPVADAVKRKSSTQSED